ncbi:ATP synthase delta (OSCP) subunit domain-containing protein [Ditylenchus destructor]|nr:ATP synthase delta (OSCP) subunit domain-containing protein [Ditylenchus destructor]
MSVNMITKRALSTSMTLGQVIRPPIPVYGVEGRYAASLYSAAHKKNSLDTADKDLKLIKDLYNTHSDFKLFIENPALNRQKKKNAITAVLKSLGVSSESQNFFGTLAENGRLNKLNAVINSFEAIMRAHRGELYVEVASADPLSKKHEQALNEVLKKFATEGQKLNVNFSVKPNMIGGLVVTIGDKYVDMSISTRLKKLTTAIQTAV